MKSWTDHESLPMGRDGDPVWITKKHQAYGIFPIRKSGNPVSYDH